MRRNFRNVFERSQQRQIENYAGPQWNPGKPATKPYSNQEIHYDGSEENGSEPRNPGEIQSQARDQENALPHGSRADFREHDDTGYEQQKISASLKHIPPSRDRETGNLLILIADFTQSPFAQTQRRGISGIDAQGVGE